MENILKKYINQGYKTSEIHKNFDIYSQLRLSRISGDLTNHFDLDEIRVTVLYTVVCLG